MYKAFIFNYVAGYFIAEILGICALYGLQALRLFCGSKGNKTETSSITFSFCALSLLTIVVNLYYLQYQTYVMLFDLILGGIAILLGLIEFVFAFVSAIKFNSLEHSK